MSDYVEIFKKLGLIENSKIQSKKSLKENIEDDHSELHDEFEQKKSKMSYTQRKHVEELFDRFDEAYDKGDDDEMEDVLADIRSTLNEAIKSKGEQRLNESFDLKRVHVGYSDRKLIPGLKGKVVFIKNEDPIIEALVELLGLAEDGKVKRFGNAYVLYNDQNKHLSFYSDEADVPKDD